MKVIAYLVAFGLFFKVGQLRAAESTKDLSQMMAGPVKEMVYLLVDKHKLKADLMTWPEGEGVTERLMSFRIAIGKEEGDKQKAGDHKTPEGIYFTKNILSQGLPAKYGPFAIPIDFPNPLDRFLGKTGHGIWLHGVEQDNRIDAEKVTEGCVAFYNADIETLARWILPSQSVIVIARDAHEVNRSEDIERVRTLTYDWIDAWAKRDLPRYISHYTDDFRYLNQDRQEFYEYKKRVFTSYRNMNLKMSQLRVFTHDRYAVVIMNEDFNGDDRYKVFGRKILYWQRSDREGWRLFHEEFDEQPIQLSTLSRERIAQIVKSSPSTKVLHETVESSRL